jgi:SNF2 family DNA or RNA helicase
MSFQQTDITRAINQNRFLVAASTGMGKSYYLAGILTHLRYYGEVNKAIILTSSIGVMNLPNELKKFIADYDEDRTLVIDSITSLKDRLVFDYDGIDIIVCGYDTFRSIGDAYDKVINKRTKKVKYKKSPLPLESWFGDKKGIIFFDECHLMGTPSSLRSKFIDMNLPFFEYRYLMSATPSDKEEKLYMILKILDNKLVNGLSYYDWLSTFCELGNKWSRYGVNKDTWNVQKWAELQNDLYKRYAVKRGKELLNLPPAYDVPTIKLDMSKNHREIYEAFTYEVVSEIKNRNNVNKAGLVENLMNTFQLLQLAVDNPLILQTTPSAKNFNSRLMSLVTNFNYQKEVTKLDALDAIIEDECIENDNKVIVFYYHPATLLELKKKYPTAFVISREIDKRDRFQVIEDFKKSKEKVIIMSIVLMNTSFTLTECKAAIYFERTWNGIDYEQSKGRIYRVGQEDEVRYYTLEYKNSIDCLQLQALDKKSKVLDNLIKKNVLSDSEWRLIFNYNQTDYLTLFKET